MPEIPYGVRALYEQHEEQAHEGMLVNIGGRIVEAALGKVVIEASLSGDRHGFPSSRGQIVHGGALATLADEALAAVALTVAQDGDVTTTSNLQVDYYRPAIPGKLYARAHVRHRSRRLAYCNATIEQEDGTVVAEARAVIAYVKG